VLLPIDSLIFLYPLFKSSQQGGSIIRCYLQLFEDTHIFYLCTRSTELPKRAHEIRCTSAVRFYVQAKHESGKITHCIEVSMDSDALDICEDIVEN